MHANILIIGSKVRKWLGTACWTDPPSPFPRSWFSHSDIVRKSTVYGKRFRGNTSFMQTCCKFSRYGCKGILFPTNSFMDITHKTSFHLINISDTNFLSCCFLFEKEHALLNRIESSTSEQERKKLERISSKQKFIATLLPIRTVGVQVSGFDNTNNLIKVEIFYV